MRIRRNPSFFSFVTNWNAESYKTCFKRRPFTLQKGVFCNVKGHLLQCKRCPFKIEMWFFLTLFHVLSVIVWGFTQQFYINSRQINLSVSDSFQAWIFICHAWLQTLCQSLWCASWHLISACHSPNWMRNWGLTHGKGPLNRRMPGKGQDVKSSHHNSYIVWWRGSSWSIVVPICRVCSQ